MKDIVNATSKAGSCRAARRAYRAPLCFVLVVLAVLVAGWGYWHFWLARPVGAGPAGPSVPRAPFQRTWTDRKIVLLGVGDSVTHGFGASEGRSYFDRLAANPPGEFEDMAGLSLSAVIPNLRPMNIAVSGSTALDHRRHIEALQPFPADVMGIVVITTGGNDIIHSYGRQPPTEGAMYGATLAQAQPWVDNFRQRLNWMVQMLAERFPGGCHVFLANIYDPTDGSGGVDAVTLWLADVDMPRWPDGPAILEAYNDIIARCADEYDFVHLVNMHDEFMGHGLNCRKFWRSSYRPEDPHYWYLDNVEDPNERGYDAIRRLFLLAMIDVFAADEPVD